MSILFWRSVAVAALILVFAPSLAFASNSANAAPATIKALGDPGTLAVGLLHTCSITDIGTVKCWGNNEFGQLGDGSTTESEIGRAHV